MFKGFAISVLTSVVFLFTVGSLMAQVGQPEPPYIPYQASLRNLAGEPVPDTFFNMTFRFFSDSVGGTLLWSETQPNVITRGGTFSTNLGRVVPCSLDIFSHGPVFLETRIGGEQVPLSPRIRLGSAPSSASSQRVSGDIMTSPGSIRMFAPQPEPPGEPLLEMQTATSGASIRMFAPQPEPPGRVNFEVASNGAARFFTQGVEYMGIDPAPFNGGGYLRMHSLAGATSLELNSGGSALFYRDGTERMGIGPSPFHSGVDFAARDSNGYNTMLLSSQGAASFFSNGSEYMGIEPSPFRGGILSMHDSAGAASVEIASSGAASFFHNGSEYMGVEPSPFGGALTMYGGVPLQPRVVLSSDGKLSLGTSSNSNILTVQQYSATDPIADAWTTYSSRRWKTNIHPLQGSLAKVMQLQGVSYDQKEGGKHDIGLIAEDVGQIVPEVVAYEDNGVDAKSIDYARLTALLVEAVKEQQKTIEQQNADIEKLQNEINDLKNR